MTVFLIVVSLSVSSVMYGIAAPSKVVSVTPVASLEVCQRLVARVRALGASHAECVP